MENITFITPTGDRPLPFVLCQMWIKKQTLQPDQWIIVDDGKTPVKPFISLREIRYLRREPRLDDPDHTLLVNLKMALPYIKGNKILFIEDDEYYAPKYTEIMAAELDKHEIVGIHNSRYYYLPTCSNCRVENKKHASLAQTVFRQSFLSEFEKLVNTKTGALDMKLWREINENKRGFLFLDDDEPLYVAMKGMPGRRGKGGGHTVGSWRYQRSFLDIAQNLLRRWIPDDDDFDIYHDIITEKLTKNNYQSYFLKENK